MKSILKFLLAWAVLILLSSCYKGELDRANSNLASAREAALKAAEEKTSALAEKDALRVELATIKAKNEALAEQLVSLQKALVEERNRSSASEAKQAVAEEKLKRKEAESAARDNPALSGRAFFRARSGEMVIPGGAQAYLLSETEAELLITFQRQTAKQIDMLAQFSEMAGGRDGIRQFSGIMAGFDPIIRRVSAKTTISPDGRFTFATAKPGKYLVYVPLVSDTASGWWQEWVQLGEQPANIELTNENIERYLSR